MYAETAGRAWPPVSVVMPVLNEERHLRAAVARVLGQNHPGDIEVVLALGPSRDRTEEIARELAQDDPRVRLVRNPSGRTPAGLNAALAVARHGIVARLDGHALLPPDYLRTAVGLLAQTGADNVGGVMAAAGETPFEQAVARAMRSRLGVGNAAFHTGGTAGPSPSVYLGVFRREILDRLGGYDETFARAQDWELNYRIRQAGGLVWFSPELEVCYRPRSSLAALASQYLHYGRWRRAISRRHPGSISLRYLAPPAALVTVVGGILLAALGEPVGLVLPAGYAAAVVLGAIWTGSGLPAGARVRLPLVYATMHFAWAAGFLTSPAELTAAAPPTPAPGAVYAVDEFRSSP